MSSAGQTPRPSIFISYSSDDRAAARLLRDALTAAGMEVWYDENELGGGDAWDAKIRRQIRECDYFMPLISASTERRKEGYFRREWRLAAERTMDMADDVLFLLPVVIDDTSEAGARVPDKFVTVQWLRAPGGNSTPALDALIKRLISGEHHAPPVTRPPLLARPTNPSTPPIGKPEPAGPPPMPAFPHHPANSGHWPKYIAEVLWWGVTAVWTIFVRLPRFFRIIIGIWLLITVLGMCKSSSNSNRSSKPKDESAKANELPPEAKEALKAVKETADALRGSKSSPGYARIGAEMAKRFGTDLMKEQLAGKPLALVPFHEGRADRAASKFSGEVFSAVYGKLLTVRPGESGISPALPAVATDEALAALGRDLKVDFVLGAQLTKADDGTSSLQVKLLHSSDGVVAWSATYPVVANGSADAADRIATAVLAAVPSKKSP